MEQFVIGIFQQQLSKIIVGFRKEQINSNLLNGKGEIRDVELNCDFLNDLSSKVTPLLEFQKVTVSKLSFHVSSWANLRKAPIKIDVGHITARVVEPFKFLNEKDGRESIQQISKEQLLALIKEGLVKTRGAYNLFDRIVDNLTIEISSVQFSFQTYGKFKTRRPGPWTPPCWYVNFSNLRFLSVNEFGHEGSPDEVWRHNHYRSGKNDSLLIYKKLCMDYNIAIEPHGSDGKIQLVSGRENQVEIQMAIKRRIRDDELLALQIDTTIPTINIDLPQYAVPHVTHAFLGLIYCLAKDREFKDPLRPQEPQGDEASQSDHEPKITSTPLDISDNASVEVQLPIDFNGDDSTSSDEEEEHTGPMSQESKNDMVEAGRAKSLPERPIILLPSGICIHESHSISVSVYEVTFRGSYEKEEGIEVGRDLQPQQPRNGYFEMQSKGCIAEFIWPKVSREMGGYVQASVAFFTIEESFQRQTKPIIVGGSHFNFSGATNGQNAILGQSSSSDERFPLFEDRAIRPDPLNLRHSFPAQAIGLKTTVDFLSTPHGKAGDVQTMHELGVEDIQITMESESLCRIASFLVNEVGGGFDPRWRSGDWSHSITPGLLSTSTPTPFDLEEHLQQLAEIFLDDNLFLSSDLFNVTARMKRVGAKIPASIRNDIKSCDVVVFSNEAMFLVSSALPRTIATGKLANPDRTLEFPSDHGDIFFEMDQAEDPSNRQRGVLTSQDISTFRVQATIREFSVRCEPIVDYYISKDRDLVAPMEATMIFCFEGQAPPEPGSDATKMAFYFTVMTQDCSINLDLDLLAASISTLLHHQGICTDRLPKIFDVVKASLADKKVNEEKSMDDDRTKRLPKTLQGRKALMKRQVTKSRTSGGVSLTSCFHFSKLSVMLWRQHVLLQSDCDGKAGFIVPAVCLLDLSLQELELGAEVSLIHDSHRLIIKVCSSLLRLSLPDFGRLQTSSIDGVDESMPQKEEGEHSEYMVPMISFRTKKGLDHAFALRADDLLENTRSLAISVDLGSNASLSIYPELFDSFLEQVWEALNMPYYQASDAEKPVGIFPCGSVGHIFEQTVDPQSLVFGLRRVFLVHTQINSFSDPELTTPEAKVNAILADVVELIPKNVCEVLVGLAGDNLVLSIDGNSVYSLFEVNMLGIDCASAYFRPEVDEPMKLLRIASAQNRSWQSLVDTSQTGLQHKWTLKQSVSCRRGNELIFPLSPFGVSWKHGQSKSTIIFDDEITFNQREHLDQFLWCLYDTWLRMKTLIDGHGAKAQTSTIVPVRWTTPVPEVLVSAMEFSDRCIERAETALLQYNGSVQMWRSKMERELKNLRSHLFRKEKERFAAHALSASQVAGWARVSMSSKFGQRETFTSTLWPYWAVLRKGYIFIHRKPSRESVVDVISLEGATLHGLTSGNNHRDLQRAFGILVRSGALYLISLSTEKEYKEWAVEVNRSIDAYGDHKTTSLPVGRVEEQLSPTVVDASQLNFVSAETKSEADSAENAVERPEPLENPLPSRQDMSDPLLNERSMKRTQIRSRFAGMGQATKSKLGSVVSRAREKGRAVAGRALSSSRSNEDTVDDTDALSNEDLLPETKKVSDQLEQKESPAVSVDSPERQRALSGVGNKLGAAVRSVRHSIRKTQSSEELPSNLQDSVKFRDIVLADPIQVPEDPIEEAEKLIHLKGNWLVHTSILNSKTHSSGEVNQGTDDEVAKKDAEVVNGNGNDILEGAFQIKVVCDNDSTNKVLTKDIFEVLSLHTTISQCIGRMRAPASYSPEVPSSNDLYDHRDPIDFVRTTAVLLEGLIDHETPTRELTPYHAQIVNEFLNAILKSRLPADGYNAFVEFLDLDRSHLREAPNNSYSRDGTILNVDPQWSYQETVSSCNKALQALKDCHLKIATAKKTLANQKSSIVQPSRESPKSPTQPRQSDPSILHLTGPVLSTRLHNSVHDALLKVMVQRDEARAKLASGEILFLQELEQQQRRIKRLEDELEASRVNMKVEDADELRRIRNMQESSDQEMLLLCQQLSNEISARTEATLELERVNEIREIERANAAAEKQSLQEQIIRLTKALEQEKYEK